MPVKYLALASITPGSLRVRRYESRTDDDPRFARFKPKQTHDAKFDRMPEPDEIEQFRQRPRVFLREITPEPPRQTFA